MERETVFALGFSPWKKRIIALCFEGLPVSFIEQEDDIPNNSIVVVWGMQVVHQANSRGLKVLRVEDGFLRSVGLGADLVRPLSLVVDRRGVHYDSSRPSDLEILLAEGVFDSSLLARAQALRERLVREGLTKYNLGREGWRRPRKAQRVILVPGQVESDASLAYGGGPIRTNLALVQAVRQAEPGAYLVYKPHPDVVAGLRRRGVDEEQCAKWCDEVLESDVTMGRLLEEVDEIHCMTSLAGFEGLLRGRRVVCYGQPFYAGWGLTQDIVPIARRQRTLSLDALVAGALILYPKYFSRDGKRVIEVEEAIEELSQWRQITKGKTPWWRLALRPLLRRIVGVR